MTLTCPQCNRPIPAEDVNVGKDVAFCRACKQVRSLSALVRSRELGAGVDLEKPPRGAWYTQDAWGTRTGATHRSIGSALGTLAFCLFWNGIVSIFVVFAMSSTLKHLGVEPPTWFPAPEMNGGPMSVGMTVFLWLFLTPFIVVGVGMAGAFLMCLAGRTEVRIRSNESEVWTGIGPIGYRRRFETEAFKAVRVTEAHWRDNDSGRSKEEILIETHAGKQIRFGSMLSAERRRFVAAAVERVLAGPGV